MSRSLYFFDPFVVPDWFVEFHDCKKSFFFGNSSGGDEQTACRQFLFPEWTRTEVGLDFAERKNRSDTDFQCEVLDVSEIQPHAVPVFFPYITHRLLQNWLLIFISQLYFHFENQLLVILATVCIFSWTNAAYHLLDLLKLNLVALGHNSCTRTIRQGRFSLEVLTASEYNLVKCTPWKCSERSNTVIVSDSRGRLASEIRKLLCSRVVFMANFN